MAASGRIVAVADAQVEQGGTADDRDVLIGDRKAAAMLFQIAHDTACRIQAEGAAAGKDHTVDLLDHVFRMQQIGLSGCRSAAADIDTGTHSFLAEDDRTAGRVCFILCLSDLDPFDL